MTKNLIKGSLVTLLATGMAYAAPAQGVLKFMGSDANGAITVSKELLNVKDVNISLGGFLYQPNIVNPSSRTNPTFEFKVQGVTLTNSDLQGFKVFEVNATSYEYNASNPVSGSGTVNSDTITFIQASSSNVHSQSWYVIAKEGSGSQEANDTANTLNMPVTLHKGNFVAPAVSIEANLYTGDSGNHISQASLESSIEIKPEYAVTIDGFSRRTNICDNEKTFTTGIGCQSGDNNDTDTITFKITKLGEYSYKFNTSADKSYLFVEYDQNESAVTSINSDTSNDEVAVITATLTSDFNSTVELNGTDINNSILGKTTVIEYTVDRNTSIKTVMKAGWTFRLVDDANNSLETEVFGSASSGAVENAAAGTWKPFGYYAMVPNVTVNPKNNILTNLVLTSRASSDLDVVITLRGNDNTCTLSTMDNPAVFGNKKLKPNNPWRLDLTDLYAACSAKLGTTKKTMVEIDIPTDPENIAVHASFIKNASVFKDLPVYHTGTLNY